MDNHQAVSNHAFTAAWNQMTRLVRQDKYQFALIACLAVGILFGSLTQALYGSPADWQNSVEGYCRGFRPALMSVAPVTVGYVTAMFACAAFLYSRTIIYPLSAVRGMGFGALICGAMQCGSLRELCFAALVLLPYCVANCVIAVYAGEYALGFRPSFNGWNEGMSDRLALHACKMLALYLTMSALSCVVFAFSCCLFGQYLI